jgi:hypothetical protein
MSFFDSSYWSSDLYLTLTFSCIILVAAIGDFHLPKAATIK